MNVVDTAREVKSFWTFKRIAYAFIAVVILVLGCIGYWRVAGCGQQMARSWGGTYTIDLDAGRKLANVTWKDNELWTLTRPMHPGDVPEEWTFQQKKVGVGRLEGSVVIRERR